MTTVGFNFTKIFAERKMASDQNIKIENNVGIVSVVESDVLDPKKSLVKFDFTFTCKYEPGLGSIELYGELIEMFDKELSSKVIDAWNKDKKVHPDIMTRILNTVLMRANIEAIIMSKELALPSPVAMPKVEVKEQKSETKFEKLEPKKPEQKKK